MKSNHRALKAALLVLSTVFLFSGCAAIMEYLAAVSAAPTATIIDGKTGDPIADASVTLTVGGETFIETSYTDGGLTFLGDENAVPPHGDYTITVDLDGYVVESKSGTISVDGQNLGTILAWSPPSGVVLDITSDTPISDVTVELSIEGGTAAPVSVTTDANGTFAFADLEPDADVTYVLQPSKAGYSFMAENFVYGDYSDDIGVIFNFQSPAGTLVDAKSGDPIEGATVTLTNADDEDFSTVTGADGMFTISIPEYGEYTLSAELTNYAFPVKQVSVAGYNVDMGTFIGFEANADDALTIATVWADDFTDVDAHLTFPAGYSQYGAFETPNDAAPAGVTTGFGPAVSGRDEVWYGDLVSDIDLTEAGWDYDGTPFSDVTKACVELDIDRKDAAYLGPETISIRSIPFDWFNNFSGAFTEYNTTPDATNKLDAGYTYAWVGIMEFYLHGYSDELMNAGQSDQSKIEVYVFQGSDFLGSYRLPEYQEIVSASLFRINMFVRHEDTGNTETEYFQITSDMKFYNETEVGTTPVFRSISEDRHTVAVTGRSR